VLRAQGDLAAALSAYRDALGITQRLVAADPSNAQCQRNLGVSHQRLGDVLMAQGDLAAALAAYRDALVIAQRLVAADPSNADWHHDLCAIYVRMATSDQSGEGGALPWLRKAYETLTEMKRMGFVLSPKDEQALAQLTALLAGPGE
jgi:tetratricopeptide (TPR) repeat protein